MKQFKSKEFIKIVIVNGYHYNRSSGDHAIYINNKGKHISIPTRKIESVIARRLIRENNLDINIKRMKKYGRLSNRSSR